MSPEDSWVAKWQRISKFYSTFKMNVFPPCANSFAREINSEVKFRVLNVDCRKLVVSEIARL